VSAATPWRLACTALRHVHSMPADCQPLLQRKQRRRVLLAARLRCTALAAAASAGPAEPREGQARQSWGEAWRAWWSVAPTPKQSEAAAAPQSLRRVVAKLWKVLNINKLQLFGALLFMVRPHVPASLAEFGANKHQPV